MSDQFLGEIRPFAFNFAPVGWAICNGQIMAISQNTALFSLLGVNYGGNGTSTFGLPNLQGSALMSTGTGPGLTPRVIGEADGSALVTLQSTQIPSHSHTFTAMVGTGQQMTNGPLAGSHLAKTLNQYDFSTVTLATTTLAPMIGVAGGGQGHQNSQPYLALNFCIALQGIFPARP